MINKFITIIVLTTLPGTQGCVSMMRPSSSNIHIDSEPFGADIVLDGNRTEMKTPSVFKVDPKKEHKIVLLKKGYKKGYEELTPKFSGLGVTMDVLLTPFFLGLAVDAINGGFNTMDSNVDVFMKLNKLNDKGEENEIE